MPQTLKDILKTENMHPFVRGVGRELEDYLLPVEYSAKLIDLKNPDKGFRISGIDIGVTARLYFTIGVTPCGLRTWKQNWFKLDKFDPHLVRHKLLEIPLMDNLVLDYIEALTQIAEKFKLDLVSYRDKIKKFDLEFLYLKFQNDTLETISAFLKPER